MKIVHVCFSGSFTDGWNYQDNLLPKWQHKNGHDVTVITSRIICGEDGKLTVYKGKNTDYINSDGVRVIRLDMKGGNDPAKVHGQAEYENFYETLESLSPEILFIHGIIFADIPEIVRYIKAHPKVILYADNHNDYSNSGGKKFTLKKFIKIIIRSFIPGRFLRSRMLIPYARKFYGVLPARVDYLVNEFRIPRNKCELLLMGADDDLVSEASSPDVQSEIRRQYNISPDDFLIMTGGKIDMAKTQTLLLMEAVKNINNPRVKLIVFGSVDEKLKQRLNELTDGTKIQYIGWVKARDTYKYFASSDLVVFPGRHSVFWEEAAGLGIPMICKEWEGTKHVDLGGNVIFLRHDSTEEIRAAIERLLTNPGEYQKMKDIAHREGMKVFSYRNIAKQSIEEYN